MRGRFHAKIVPMNFPLPSLVRAGLTGCLFVLAACKTAPPPPPPPPPPTPGKPTALYEWQGDGKAINMSVDLFPLVENGEKLFATTPATVGRVAA